MESGPHELGGFERQRLCTPACRREVVTFFLISYGFSWLCFLPLVPKGDGPYQFIIVGSFGPTLAALACQRMYAGNYGAFQVLGSPVRTVASAALGAALVTLAYVVIPSVLLTGTVALNWTLLASPRLYSFFTFLGGPLGEEPGWRGYALIRMEACSGPLPAAVLLAVLWTGWHLPLFFVNGWTTSPIWVYMLIVLGLSVIFSFIAHVARFAVLPAILMHAVFNRANHVIEALVTGFPPAIDLRFDLVLAVCGLLVAMSLAIITKGRLGACSRP